MKMKFRNKKYLILLISWILINSSHSQGFIQIRTNNTNYLYFGPNEIWNIQVLSTKTKSVQATIEAFITNSNGALIYQASSGTVEIKPGIEVYSANQIPVVKSSVLDKQVDQFLRITQTFPNGQYSVCYTIQEVNIAEELEQPTPITNCIEVESEIQTPLILNTPINESEIFTLRPNFTWIPPMPIGAINGFNYNFYLYASEPLKSCAEVISSTQPIYKNQEIFSNSISYPAELPQLDTSKHYCWRVEGLLNKTILATSDIWRFKIKIDQEKLDTLRYVHFIENPAAIKVSKNTILMCDFDGHYFGDTLNATISGNNVIQMKVNIIKVTDHENTKAKPGVYSNTKYIIDPKLILSLEPGLYIIKAINNSYNQKQIKLNIY